MPTNSWSDVLCTVSGCNKLRHAKSYCKNHYMKFYKYGDPNIVICKTIYGESLQWLKDHINFKEDECLKWPYGCDRHGRGEVYFDGKRYQAHRLMCIWVYGEPPFEDAKATHSCGKGHEACVNPGHLEWATQLKNQHDRIKHNTTNRGENQGRAKLSAQDVREIKDLFNYFRGKEIAKLYNISEQTISGIKHNRSWSYD